MKCSGILERVLSNFIDLTYIDPVLTFVTRKNLILFEKYQMKIKCTWFGLAQQDLEKKWCAHWNEVRLYENHLAVYLSNSDDSRNNDLPEVEISYLLK